MDDSLEVASALGSGHAAAFSAASSKSSSTTPPSTYPAQGMCLWCTLQTGATFCAYTEATLYDLLSVERSVDSICGQECWPAGFLSVQLRSSNIYT